MTAAAQPITAEQLARLYAAANRANSDLDAARRTKDKDLIERMRQRARALNSAYDSAKRQYKRQQKASRRGEWRSTMIRFYIDHQEADRR